MARIRTIKPELWESQKLGSLSSLARITFVGLISIADDEGRGRGDPGFLFGRLHPYSKETLDQLKAALLELQDMKLVNFYSIEGFNYYFLPNFNEHQKIDRPRKSTIPPPTRKNSTNIRRTFDEASTNVRCSIKDGNGMDGNGKDIVADEPQKPLTEIQQIVEAYKIVKGVGGDKGWDKANFGRYAKSAKSLLECCGSVEMACQAITSVVVTLKTAGLDWTLETITRHAWDGRREILGPGYEKDANVAITSNLEAAGGNKTGGPTQTTLGANSVHGLSNDRGPTPRRGGTASSREILARFVVPPPRSDGESIETHPFLAGEDGPDGPQGEA